MTSKRPWRVYVSGRRPASYSNADNAYMSLLFAHLRGVDGFMMNSHEAPGAIARFDDVGWLRVSPAPNLSPNAVAHVNHLRQALSRDVHDHYMPWDGCETCITLLAEECGHMSPETTVRDE